MNPELSRELKLIKKRLDDLEQNRREVPLGLSLIAPPQILSGAVASVTFSDISQGYSHLTLVCQARTSVAAETDVILLRFNGDTGSNYDAQVFSVIDGTLLGVAGRAATSIGLGRCEGANSRASNFSPTQAKIFGYSLTDREKWLQALSASFGDVSADADLREEYRTGRWRSTAAITSITLLPNTGPNFVAGSEFQLYGVR